CQQGNTLPPTF
nr:immunoglobulin light chain junction region [Mus musculus]NSL99913.1 immunoglobulin light chain junction region [Mus musculus]